MKKLLLIAVPRLVGIFIMAGSGYLQAWNLNSGRSPTLASVKDFGATGDLRRCADMQMKSGSTSLTSRSQCNFAQADVNKWVQVPHAGDSFGTALSARIVSVQDSQHATLSVAAGATVTAATISYTDLVIPAAVNAIKWRVHSSTHPFTPDLVGDVLTIAGGPGFTIGNYTIGSVDYFGTASILGAAIVGNQGSTGGTGSVALAGTIATGDYGAISAAASYLCAHPGNTLLFPPGIYYIEKFRKDDGGPNPNGVTDIVWQDCNNVAISGYGATVEVNGSFRRINDGRSVAHNNAVIPFVLDGATDMIVQGLELYGSVDKMTKESVAEGQDYGIILRGTKRVTLRDLNTHHWATDGIDVGSLGAPYFYSDRDVTLDHIWTHNNARNGMTISNVENLFLLNFQASQAGVPWTGNYGGHSPVLCVDIEPPVATDLPGAPTGEVVFEGGYITTCEGGSLISTAGAVDSLRVFGMTFDNSAANNSYGRPNISFGMGTARRTLFEGNHFLTQKFQGFGCVPDTRLNTLSQRVDFVDNDFQLDVIPDINCNSATDGLVKNIYFRNNNVHISGAAIQNGYMNFNSIREVSGNSFYIDAGSKYAGVKDVVVYNNVQTVQDNTYSTNSTNAVDPYRVAYRNVRYWRNERSLNPIYFVVTSDGGEGK